MLNRISPARYDALVDAIDFGDPPRGIADCAQHWTEYADTHESKYLRLLDAAETSQKVAGLTHDFYRYPARFGPAFVREAIQSFSRSGDVVLDPFMGGGTTLVEAAASERIALGSDVSQLAMFVARSKTTPLSDYQIRNVERWIDASSKSTRPLLSRTNDASDIRLLGLPQPYRNLLCNLKSSILTLPRGPSREFAKCLLLRTTQWAFDGKEVTPRPTEIVGRLRQSFDEMAAGLRDFRSCVKTERGKRSEAGVLLANCAARDLKADTFGAERKVDLVVTSPPYLGVHVLYNKWQLRGRTELRAAFFLSDTNDIGGASAYTIVDRKARSSAPYYTEIERSFSSVRKLLKKDAYVIQLVSFHDARSALPNYLDALKRSGLELCETYAGPGRDLHWRAVPGRRWYARVGAVSDSSASKEVLLIHRNRE